MAQVDRRVLVTGATGFTGRAVAESLRAARWTVRATGREPSRCPPGCEFVAADLTLPADFDGLVRGVDAIVHLAARVHVMHDTARDPLAEFRGANVIPTARLAEAAARQGVRQLVFASSVKVNGERTGARPYTEATTPAPEDAYGVSKLEAEHALEEVAGRSALGVTILRPPLMYGPGVKGNFERLIRWVRRGVPLPLGAVHNRRSLLYVGNFASAVATALERPADGYRRFLLSDGEDLATPALIRRVAHAMHRRAVLLPVPVGLLRLGARVAGRDAELRRLTDSLVVDATRLRETLGWKPPFSVDEGLAATVGDQ